MKNTKTIFGFGSLIYGPSLLASAPNAIDVRPAYILGYMRSFNVWDATGYTDIKLDYAREPMCALNIKKTSKNPKARVNGVTFKVTNLDLEQLILREAGYDLLRVPVYDYDTKQLIDADCLVFSAHKNDGKYVYHGKAQQRYLNDYLSAAKQYGEEYYQEILHTTFIDNKPLCEFPQLLTKNA